VFLPAARTCCSDAPRLEAVGGLPNQPVTEGLRTLRIRHARAGLAFGVRADVLARGLGKEGNGGTSSSNSAVKWGACRATPGDR